MEIQAEMFSDSSGVDMEDPYAISSPIPMMIILALYLLTVLKIAPSFMKSRPAYQLKTFIVYYNIFQLVSCTYVVYKICVINLPTMHFWKCVHYKRGSIEEKDFNHISMFVFFLKITELSETVVFVLRKKQKQVSFLHVFHHCCTLFLAYHLCNTYKASSALYPVFLNSNVHIIMYFYYLLAAVLPSHVASELIQFKKAITTIQIVQFIVILLQVIITLSRGCKMPAMMLSIYVVIMIVFSFMFYDFYKKNYSVREKERMKIQNDSE